jgi:negative regulator of genetic competence, sporulation and motility
MTYNLKQFRTRTFKESAWDDLYNSDSDNISTEAIKRRYLDELRKAEIANRENTSAVLELRDMEDELTTLYKLFDTQESTLKLMKGIYMSPELNDSTHNGQVYLDEALARLDEYKQQTNEMRRRVDTTRKDVSWP